MAVTDRELPYEQEYDKTGLYVSPGFIDMHTHGGAGHEFFDTAADLVASCNFHLSHGTTSICPTISAAPFYVMQRSVEQAKLAKEDTALKSNLIGLHMEGPYLSPEQCGAQCTDYITPPVPEQYEKLIDEAGDLIARWTYAPENDRDGRFRRYLTECGILASAGHTNAVYEDIKRAKENDCKRKDRSAFAGSVGTADMLVRVMVKAVGLSVTEAVKMLTKTPAEIMTLNKGRLKPGLDADIVVFDSIL